MSEQDVLKLAGCIILDENDKVFLLHRNTVKRQQWEVPGGKVEDNEEAKTTAVREIKEELGVDVEITSLTGEKEFTEDGFTMRYSWFGAKILGGQPQIMEPETFDKLSSFSIQEMRVLFDELSPNAQNFLVALEKGNITLT